MACPNQKGAHLVRKPDPPAQDQAPDEQHGQVGGTGLQCCITA